MTKFHKKIALITGVHGMDGSHLSDYLISLGYTVYGLQRRSTVITRQNTKHLLDNQNFHLIQGDLTDQNSLLRALSVSNPDQIYNLGAQSFVEQSFRTPQHTSNVTGLGCLRMLQAIRQFSKEKYIKFYQASSSEMFGKMVESPANEYTPFYPRSPYGVAKVFAHYMTKNYRESYDMFCCSGILFNHESERRGKEFVTRKITYGIKQILEGKQDHIELGNLDARRDWGSAQKYVEAMHLMLQQPNADDYVVATGESHSIKQFLDIAFKYVGLDHWQKYVHINPIYFRPAQVDVLCGNSSKIRSVGWNYNMTFEDLVKTMIDKELSN